MRLKKLRIIIENPKFIIIGKGALISNPIEDSSQAIRLIEKCLLSKSMIADKIYAEKK